MLVLHYARAEIHPQHSNIPIIGRRSPSAGAQADLAMTSAISQDAIFRIDQASLHFPT